MTDGFEEARDRRNWLEKLGQLIPGFKGFQDRELRRDVDRMQREYLAHELGRIKGRARGVAGEYTDAGRIGDLDLFERVDRRLDGLSQAIRFADYGATGLFDVVKVYEPELERLYEFDVSVLEDVAALEAAVDAIPRPGQGDVRAAVEGVLAGAASLDEKWAARETVISDVVATDGDGA